LLSPFFKVAVLLAVLFLAAASRPAPALADSPVGLARLTVPGNTALRGDPMNTLNVTVWYPAPTGTAMEPTKIGPPQTPSFIEGEAANDAPLATSPVRMPLIVFSHGTGGNAMNAAWLCEALAARGYIVAAVDHPGNNSYEPPTVAGTTVWWMRADDLSRVIDGMLASPRFGAHIDPSRIGAAGYSIGGYTVLVIGGAQANPAQIDSYCAQKPTTALCTGHATPTIPDIGAAARALAATNPAYRAAVMANTDSHRDPRVKAIFSIAPALGPALIPQSLQGIDVPVALVAGFGDSILPVADNIIPDALAIPNAELTLLPKPVDHYTFLSNCTSAGMQRLGELCADSGSLRLVVHRATIDLARSFFARTISAP
jgi:predicted dienelactone hydrolase